MIEECDGNDTSNYEADWISNAVPIRNNITSKCLRYQRNFVENLTNNETCGKELFNRNRTINCDRFVYESDKVTIAQDVSNNI